MRSRKALGKDSAIGWELNRLVSIRSNSSRAQRVRIESNVIVRVMSETDASPRYVMRALWDISVRTSSRVSKAGDDRARKGRNRLCGQGIVGSSLLKVIFKFVREGRTRGSTKSESAEYETSSRLPNELFLSVVTGKENPFMFCREIKIAVRRILPLVEDFQQV